MPDGWRRMLKACYCQVSGISNSLLAIGAISDIIKI